MDSTAKFFESRMKSLLPHSCMPKVSIKDMKLGSARPRRPSPLSATYTKESANCAESSAAPVFVFDLERDESLEQRAPSETNADAEVGVHEDEDASFNMQMQENLSQDSLLLLRTKNTAGKRKKRIDVESLSDVPLDVGSTGQPVQTPPAAVQTEQVADAAAPTPAELVQGARLLKKTTPAPCVTDNLAAVLKPVPGLARGKTLRIPLQLHTTVGRDATNDMVVNSPFVGSQYVPQI